MTQQTILNRFIGGVETINEYEHSERFNVSLRKKWRLAFQTGVLTDLIFYVGAHEEQIRCHRLVLAINSTVFFDMFRDQGSMWCEYELILREHDAMIFRKFLMFLYTEEVTFTMEDIPALYSLAVQYKVVILCDKCEKLMKFNLSVMNAVNLLQTARRFFNKDLEKACLDYMRKNSCAILGHYKSTIFPKEDIMYILNDENVNEGSENGERVYEYKSQVRAVTTPLPAPMYTDINFSGNRISTFPASSLQTYTGPEQYNLNIDNLNTDHVGVVEYDDYESETSSTDTTGSSSKTIPLESQYEPSHEILPPPPEIYRTDQDRNIHHNIAYTPRTPRRSNTPRTPRRSKTPRTPRRSKTPRTPRKSNTPRTLRKAETYREEEITPQRSSRRKPVAWSTPNDHYRRKKDYAEAENNTNYTDYKSSGDNTGTRENEGIDFNIHILEQKNIAPQSFNSDTNYVDYHTGGITDTTKSPEIEHMPPLQPDICQCIQNSYRHDLDQSNGYKMYHSPRKTEFSLLNDSCEIIYPPKVFDVSSTAEMSEELKEMLRVDSVENESPRDLYSSINVSPKFISGSKKGKCIIPPRVYKGSYTEMMQKKSNEHIFPSDLKPLDAPRLAINSSISLLKEKNWENNLEGFELVVRLIRHHPDVIVVDLPSIIWAAERHLTSSKSSLSRAAIVCFKELFNQVGKAMESESDKVVERILNKSMDTNKFIRLESSKALEAMVKNLPPLKSLSCLEYGFKHKNSHILAMSARMLTLWIKNVGVDKSVGVYADKIFPHLMRFLQLPGLDARLAAKEAMEELITHPQFYKHIKRVVTTNTLITVSHSVVALKRMLHDYVLNDGEPLELRRQLHCTH